MEKVEIQITKGLTEETTEEITLLGHILLPGKMQMD